MKRPIINLLSICALLIVAPTTFTGCATNEATREAIIYYSFKDVQTIVHRAYDVFAERVVLGKVSASERAEVENAYVAYQDLFRTAFATAQMDLSKPTPAELRRLADEVVKLIYKL